MLRCHLVARYSSYLRFCSRQISQNSSELSSDAPDIRKRNKEGVPTSSDSSGDLVKPQYRSTQPARRPSFYTNEKFKARSHTTNSSKSSSRRFVNDISRASNKSQTYESIGHDYLAATGRSHKSEEVQGQLKTVVHSSDRFGDSVPDAFAEVGVSRAELQVLDDESETEFKEDKSPGAEKLRKVHVYKLRDGNRNTRYWYERRIRDCVRFGLVGDALRILEDDMLVKDGVLPSVHGFSLCIAACADIGYVSKAFALFDTMCRLDLEPTPHVLTSLFHCCAKAISIKEEFERADRRGLQRIVNFASRSFNLDQPLNGSQNQRPSLSINHQLRLKSFASDDNASIQNAAQEMVDDRSDSGVTEKSANRTFDSNRVIDKRGAIDSAFERASKLYESITAPDSKFAPLLNRYVLNAAMRCFSERGAYEECWKIYEKMCAVRIWPDTYTTSALLHCCLKRPATGFRDAIETFNRLRNAHRRLQVNDLHYAKLLDCVARCGFGERPDDTASETLVQSVFSRRLSAALINISDLKKMAYLRLRAASKTAAKQLRSDDQNGFEYAEALKEYKKLEQWSTILSDGTEPPRSVMHTLTLTRLKEVRRVTVNVEKQALVLKLTQNDSCDQTNSTKIDIPDRNIDIQPAGLDKDWSINSPFSLIDADLCTAARNATFSVSLHDLNNSPGARFALLGGLQTFLRSLKADGIDTISMKVMTKLCSVLPNTKEADDALLTELRKNPASLQQLDVQFINSIIRRARQRRDNVTVSQSLSLLSERGLQVNVITFAALAINCSRRSDAVRLLADMRLANLRPNAVVLNTLLDASGYDFHYKRFLLEYASLIALCPNRETLIIIESQIERARARVRKIEKACRAARASRTESANVDQNDTFFLSKYFVEGYSSFRKFYRQWLCKTTVDDREERHRQAPFAAYRTEADDKPIQIVKPRDRTS